MKSPPDVVWMDHRLCGCFGPILDLRKLLRARSDHLHAMASL
jgi:hypothetical protein